MITDTTTIAELAEILRAKGPMRALTFSAPDHKDLWWVLSRDGWSKGDTLAAAISAALEKAGAR